MFPKLVNTFSSAWLWWLQIINSGDEWAAVLLTSAIGLLAVLWLIFNKSSNCQPPLPPGPKGLPLVGNLLSLDPELHVYFAKLSQTYGPILTIRLGGKLGIVISSPVIAREVLKDQDTIFANDDVLVAGKEASYGGTDIVWTPYGPEWRMLRKVCVHEMLSNTTLDSVYDLRRTEVRKTIKYFYSQAGSPVNMGEHMFLTVLNVITNMLWGGVMKGEERSKLGAEFRGMVAEMTTLFGLPNLSDFYPSLAKFDLQGIHKKMKKLVKRFDLIFETMIEQRLKMDGVDGEESKDFLQFLLRLKDQHDAKIPFTITHVKALLMDMVVGGTETTSNLMEFVMAEMMNKPEILRKVQLELERVVGKDHIVEEFHIEKLPFLYAVMKEVLRLHPVLPLMVPRCPSETSIIAGYTIPKGARIFVNVWAIHRDPSNWENPLEFNPERFLNAESDYSGNNFNYLPFGSGRRSCAGTAMAERMFMYSVASIVHSFEWRLPVKETLDLSEKFGIVLKKRIPLIAIPIPRLSSPTMYD